MFVISATHVSMVGIFYLHEKLTSGPEEKQGPTPAAALTRKVTLEGCQPHEPLPHPRWPANRLLTDRVLFVLVTIGAVSP